MKQTAFLAALMISITFNCQSQKTDNMINSVTIAELALNKYLGT